MDSPAAERPLGPSQEGSEQAQLVLRRMHAWRSPITRGELAMITGLSADTLLLALRGLKERGRVVCDGNGNGEHWQLAHYARAAR